MILLLWLALAAAEDAPPSPPVFETALTLGAQFLPRVGDEADLAANDPVGAEGVRVVPMAAELGLRGPASTFALLRVEEGIFHAGALEASEARVGFVNPKGWGGLWVGRGELQFSRDRESESEDQTFSVRPMISRVALPFHANGLGLALALPDRVTLEAGQSYATATADAPLRWARLRIHPLGALPDRPDAAVDGIRLQIGGGLVDSQSEALGDQRLLAGDLSLALGPAQVEGQWLRQTREGEDPRGEWIAALGSRVVRLPGADLHLALRGERVTGFEATDDPRYLGAGRLALRDASGKLTLYGEYLLSREPGTGVAPGEAVVALPGGAERDNDALAIGLTLRLLDAAR